MVSFTLLLFKLLFCISKSERSLPKMKFLNAYFSVIIICVLFSCYSADKYVDNIGLDVQDDPGCECTDNNSCGCCTPLYVKDVIDSRLCGNITYFSEDIGISVTITYNDKTVLNETVRASSPPSLCVYNLEELDIFICLHFYDLNFTDCFSGCAEVEVEFEFFKILNIPLGCFGCRHQNKDVRKTPHVINESKKGEIQPEVILI